MADLTNTQPMRTVRPVASAGEEWFSVGADDEFAFEALARNPRTIDLTMGAFRFPGEGLAGRLSLHVATQYTASGTHTVELVQGDRVVLTATDTDISEHDIDVTVPADVIAGLSYDGHGIARPALTIRYTAALLAAEVSA